MKRNLFNAYTYDQRTKKTEKTQHKQNTKFNVSRNDKRGEKKKLFSSENLVSSAVCVTIRVITLYVFELIYD